jgi:hypothetical protein
MDSTRSYCKSWWQATWRASGLIASAVALPLFRSLISPSAESHGIPQTRAGNRERPLSPVRGGRELALRESWASFLNGGRPAAMLGALKRLRRTETTGITEHRCLWGWGGGRVGEQRRAA